MEKETGHRVERRRRHGPLHDRQERRAERPDTQLWGTREAKGPRCAVSAAVFGAPVVCLRLPCVGGRSLGIVF